MRASLRRPIGACVVSSLALVAACGVRARHEMDVPPKELTYADACRLQTYFDERANAGLTAPQAADEMLATNDKGQTIGEGTYVLKDPLARRRFARLLREDYDGVDRKIVHAVESTDGRVSVHVRWWDAGPIRRLRPSGEVIVQTPVGDEELPPNPCVSDFLFGDKVYAMRARFLRNEVDLETGRYETGDAGAPLPDLAPSSNGPSSSAPSSSVTPAPKPPASPSAAASANLP